MNPERVFFRILFLVIVLTGRVILSNNLPAQDDPVLSPEVSVVPVIDGIADDICWQNVPWQAIDQVWIPYDGTIEEGDYSGRYKVVWSSATNLLYFLVEINDDVFVDGWTTSTWAGIYEYDITEVFIDENDSGGEHRLDTDNSNGENAFAYHMYSDYPAPGEVNNECYVEDRAGTTTNWSNLNYADHFPEFALRVDSNTATREFSLIVYNDTYVAGNPDSGRAVLYVDKQMGLSLAYCDNDNPNENPKTRENMFGSVWEPSPGNLHWMNADTFGNVKLVSDLSTGMNDSQDINNSFALYENYPNPFNPSTNISFYLSESGYYTLKVFDLLGREISTMVQDNLNAGNHQFTFNFSDLTSGTYVYQLSGNGFYAAKKMTLIK